MNTLKVTIVLLVIVAVGGIAGTWWYLTDQKKAAVGALQSELQDTQARGTEELTKTKTDLEQQIAELTSALATTTAERDDFQSALENVTGKYNDVTDKVGSALTTVGQLDKLSKIDKELLQKYSKVYFLNENYRPAKLSTINSEYVYSDSKQPQLQSQTMPFFTDMVKDAKDDGVDLYVVSAFRSFEEQKSLKSSYSVTYGTGANAFSADQGYSEHQLGTTIDFTTTGINGSLTGFDATPAYTWLKKNAYKYGFELSYPKGNQYYVYEPWHWRFVGTKLTRMLHNEDKNFYDIDQRTIDTYLISLFD